MKGEMGSSVTRMKSEWRGHFGGWHEWKYSLRVPKITKRQKAGIMIGNMKKFDLIPTKLTAENWDSTAIIKIIVAVAGDSLYIGTIKEMNAVLSVEFQGTTAIYKSITGKNQFFLQ